MSEMIGGYHIEPSVNVNAEGMTKEQAARFEKAFIGIVGAGYVPLMYIGSQRVNGNLYAYIAQRTFIHSQSVKVSIVKVVIFESFDGELAIHSISEI